MSLDYLLKITDDPNVTIANKELDKKVVGENLKKIKKITNYIKKL